MKKIVITSVSTLILAIFVISLSFGIPNQRYLAQDFAKRAVQARTFDIYEITSTTYNIFTQKYRIKLKSTHEDRNVYALISFKENGYEIEEMELIGIDDILDN